MTRDNANHTKKFTCAGCDRVLPEDEIAIACDTCNGLFCRQCASDGTFKRHANDEQGDIS